MLVLLVILGCLGLGLGLFLQQPKFGKLPEGARLERIKASAHYADGKFQNLIFTPQITGEKSFARMLFEYLFVAKERLTPAAALPSVKTDLKNLDAKRDLLVWLGHSSFYLQLGGKKILVDPVFSDHASPVSFSTRAFAGTSPYSANDMPEIDYLVISHDHWDHLDHPSVMALKAKIKNIVCGLGVGAHFEYWGFASEKIIEADWFTSLEPEPGFFIHILPARHFSGRGLIRDKSLWISCALETPQRRIFYSGDSGYGPHFTEIGEKFGEFDLAILENGQYDKNWQNIHMMPEETALAAKDLRAKTLLPVHAGKFSIASHAWDDPFKRLDAAGQEYGLDLRTPKIGEPLYLEGEKQSFSKWWEGLE